MSRTEINGLQIADGTVEAIDTQNYMGSYNGNDVANRPIAHGMGVAPQAIFICNTDGKLFTMIIPGTISYGNLIKSVQVWDATNFYVGPNLIGHANQTGKTYHWVVFG